MILGLDRHVHAQCFVELNDAVEAYDRERGIRRTVALNAHRFPTKLEAGDIVWNLENPEQFDPAAWTGHRVWDFSRANAAKYTEYAAVHVPVGFHESMVRFDRARDFDIDVVFSGSINVRRAVILGELRARGLNVVLVPHETYGAGRDALLARAKVAINMQFYPEGAWPALRVAHLVANRVPVVSEEHADCWPFVTSEPYARLVDRVDALARGSMAKAAEYAERAFEDFRRMPLELPA